MNIAIIGWGSLIWDPRELPHYGPWRQGGPKLPIEFSRVSKDGRLTLVIDPSAEVIPTCFAISPRTDIDDAVEDLRQREGTGKSQIGCFDALTKVSSLAKHPNQHDVTSVIQTWCDSQKIDACVWTALPPNFEEAVGKKFSVETAVEYLEGLAKPVREVALKYMSNAPAEVDTLVRRAVDAKWPK